MIETCARVWTIVIWRLITFLDRFERIVIDLDNVVV